MKSVLKKLFALIIISILTLFIIYYSNLKRTFFKKDVYVIFDVEKDNYKEIDWSKYAHLFPKEFYPENVLIDIQELQKLNKEQIIKFDSIKKEIYQYPRKIIKLDNNKRKFIIAVDPNIAIEFKNVNSKVIEPSKLNSLNILSLDTLIHIIPELEYLQLKSSRNSIKKFENARFNIIELGKNKATVIEVEPIVIEYN